MRAAICHQFEPPDVVSIEDVDKPIPKDNEVLIRVKATSVNRTDCGFRAGEPKFARIIMGLTKPRYPILGCEFAGDIVEIGAAVKKFHIGGKVFGYCEDNYNFGGHGEYKAMNVKGMLKSGMRLLNMTQSKFLTQPNNSHNREVVGAHIF